MIGIEPDAYESTKIYYLYKLNDSLSANVIFTYYLRIVVLKKFFKKDFGNLFFQKSNFFFTF